jgi:SAM-dependent methyltransferase
MSASTNSDRSYVSDSLRARLPQPARRLARTAAVLAEKGQMRMFDALIGVATAKSEITEGSLFVAGGDNTAYAACQWLSVRSALTQLSPSGEDVFVDIGAGKGKAMLIAARLGYKRVLGVERDAGLATQAQQNVDLARPRLKTAELEVVNADALTWPIPDDVSLVFLNCPFIGETFHQVAARIIDSFDHARRPLHLVYSKPWEHDWLLSTGRVSVVGVQPRFWPAQPGWWRTGNVIVTYRVMAQGDSATGSSQLHGWRGRNRQALDRWSAPNGQVFDIITTEYGTLSSGSRP